ncbi:MAG: twin-arginine translocase subunit TatB [Thalassovita sp.]
MFDLGMAELLIVGTVALIVVGPKDLPKLFRNVGQFVGKAKGMAREFSRAMDQAADESGMKDVQQGLKAATNPAKFGLDQVKDAAKDFTSWEPDTSAGLSEERADMAKKIHDATAQKAQARLDAAAAAEAAAAEQAANADADVPAAPEAADIPAPTNDGAASAPKDKA